MNRLPIRKSKSYWSIRRQCLRNAARIMEEVHSSAIEQQTDVCETVETVVCDQDSLSLADVESMQSATDQLAACSSAASENFTEYAAYKFSSDGSNNEKHCNGFFFF